MNRNGSEMELPEKIAQHLNILVVDDEPNIRKVLSMALEAEGHQVAAVGNSKDALRESNRRFSIWRLLISGLERNPGWS